MDQVPHRVDAEPTKQEERLQEKNNRQGSGQWHGRHRLAQPPCCAASSVQPAVAKAVKQSAACSAADALPAATAAAEKTLQTESEKTETFLVATGLPKEEVTANIAAMQSRLFSTFMP